MKQSFQPAPRSYLIMIGLATLVACGGGGGDGGGSGPGPIVSPDPNCRIEVKSGFTGVAPQDGNGLGLNEGQGDGFGGDGDGDGAGEGIGAGGSLGQFRNTRVVVKNLANPEQTGEGVTDDVKGMVSLKLCDIDQAHEVAFIGGEGATYFDEARKQFVPFAEGKQLRTQVVVARTRGFIGVTPYTEAATQRNQNEEGQAFSNPGAAGLKSATKAIDESNRAVAAILADQLPGVYRANDGGGLFDITGLPVVLNDENVDQPGTLTDNNRGRYGAANAGLAVLAGTFLSNDPTPALTISEQLGRDLTDGRLDMVDSSGCSIVGGEAANGGCAPDDGDIGYTYETLWRGKTVATGQTSSQAGDASLRDKRAFVAVYRVAARRAYQSCAFPRGTCEPLLRATVANQTVSLDSNGQLTIRRGLSAPFGDQLRFITRESGDRAIAGTYVEVKVGSRGEVIALTSDRSAFVFIDPLEVYAVTGQEPLTPDGFDLPANNDPLQAAIDNVQTVRIDIAAAGVSNPRAASFTPSPGARVFQDGANGVAPAFLYLLPNGQLRAVRPSAQTGSFNARWGNPEQFDLPQPDKLTAIVYDKYAVPGLVDAYGPAPSQAVVQPYRGPRRLYGLTRTGTVRTWLEGAAAPGVELAVPGRVVQIVGEAAAGVYALNSLGQVFWLNPDQAFNTSDGINGRGGSSLPNRVAPLNSVQQLTIPEQICWITRTEAVACNSGQIYRWNERLVNFVFEPTRFNACGIGSAGAIRPGTDDIARVGTGISDVNAVSLAADIGPIWRLNAADEFSYARNGTFRETCQVDGVRFLGVNGTETDEAGARGLRSIAGTRSTFTRNGQTLELPYITGQQLRVALETASAAFAANGPGVRDSTGPVGFRATIDMNASAGQGSFSHSTKIFSQQGTDRTRPDLRIEGGYSSSGGNSTVDITRMIDETGNRALAVNGSARSWSDNDLVALNGIPFGEWEVSDPNPNCANCEDERRQSQRWQTMILPTTDAEDQYGFRVCLRIRVEGVSTSTADIRFACTQHDNDGRFRRTVTMTDRVLSADGSLDLIDFRHL
ncbi:MAG: hypothetical protein AB8C46_26160 [Burkholderiaceae bacterium]